MTATALPSPRNDPTPALALARTADVSGHLMVPIGLHLIVLEEMGRVKGMLMEKLVEWAREEVAA